MNISGIIRENRDFIVLTHIFPDGDAIGSQVALYELLSSLKKNVHLVCNSDLPYQYQFMPAYRCIRKKFPKNGRDQRKKYVYIYVDCADESRTELDFGKLPGNLRVIINIDHHNSNNNFGDINLVDKHKAATCEIIYDYIKNEFPDCLNYNMAVGLYVGILTDTGRFQYSNTTENIHKIAGDLLRIGVSPPEIYGYIYENDPLNRFKLVRLVFKRIRFISEIGLIYSYILQKDFKRLSLPFYAQDGIIELLRSAKGAKVKVLIKEIGKNSYKISLRTSDKKINLAEIAKEYGGGGHRTAAAYTDYGSLEKVAWNLEELVKKNT